MSCPLQQKAGSGAANWRHRSWRARQPSATRPSFGKRVDHLELLVEYLTVLKVLAVQSVTAGNQSRRRDEGIPMRADGIDIIGVPHKRMDVLTYFGDAV